MTCLCALVELMMSIKTQITNIRDYEFFQINDKANIALLHNSYRYDLSDNSHLNKEIYKFNSKLKDTEKLYNHVKI
jgi:hypothetical protein